MRYFLVFYFDMTFGQMSTPFCLVPLLAIWFLSSTVYALIAIYIDARKRMFSVTSALPLVTLVLTLIALATVTINPSKVVFGIYGSKYQEVVEMIENGTANQWPSSGGGWLDLPEGYKYLSRRGTVRVTIAGGAQQMLFITTNSIDSFSGILYRSDGKPPQLTPDYGYGGPPGKIFPIWDRLDSHWYQVQYAH